MCLFLYSTCLSLVFNTKEKEIQIFFLPCDGDLMSIDNIWRRILWKALWPVTLWQVIAYTDTQMRATAEERPDRRWSPIRFGNECAL